MADFQKLRTINKLKTVYRAASVGNRRESSAEHSWSCLVLADFFLSKTKKKIDRLKVYELLIYHDLCEIESGDFPLSPKTKRKDENRNEREAAQRLRKKLPLKLGNKFSRLFREFREQRTVESRFAKAIDALDAEIHELDYKKDWKGWTKEFLLEKKAGLFREFRGMEKEFYSMLRYLERNGYLDARK